MRCRATLPSRSGKSIVLVRNAATAVGKGVSNNLYLESGALGVDEYTSSLRSCNSILDVKRVHRHILGGLQSRDRLLQNVLIETYGRLGSLEDARAVFDRIACRNVFSWTLMMAAYAQEGHITQALGLFQTMLLDGTRPDKVSLLKGIQACVSVEQGRKIGKLVDETGLGSDTLLGNARINMYGKCGTLRDAEEAFQEMPRKDLVSWNTMLAIYAQHGEASKAIRLFHILLEEEKLKPDKVTYISLLEVCGNVNEGEKLHRMIVAAELESDAIVANAVMNMYGKLGALDKARSVFDCMDERNVVSWNTIIGAYAHNGCRSKALELFRRMDLECVSPDKVTFVHMLDASTGAAELDMICSRVAASGFGSDTIVTNSLVHLHGKYGSPDAAKRVFDKMQSRNVSSWNSIVDVYANNGLDKEAFGLFRRMQQHGYKADKVTFLCVIDACSCLEEGREVHAQVTATGLHQDTVVQTALLQMYTKHSNLGEAWDVFQAMENKDIFAWNSMLTAFAHHNRAEEVTCMFHEMMIHGMKADEVTFVNLLDACTSLVEGLHLHACAVESGFESSSITVGNTLISMYARCGCMEEAGAVFDRMAEKSSVTWNSMILAFVQQEHGDMCFNLLSRMQLEGTRPDRVTFLQCMDACKDLEQTRRLHRQILFSGLQTDTAVGNSLINTYRRCESLDDSVLVFEGMADRDLVSWTSIISAYGDGGLAKSALVHWQKMQLEGVEPDGVTFASVLEACSGLFTLSQGESLHLQVEESGAKNMSPVGPALITMYSSYGTLDRARSFFDGMDARSKDVFTWNAMLEAYSRQGDGRTAMHLFRLMDLEGVPANTVTVVTVLDSCSKNSRGLLQARSVHRSITSNLIIDNTLVNVYGKCGSLLDARTVFDSMLEKALVSWNSIITSTAQHGKGREARKLFWKMQQDGVKPDHVTLMSIAASCQHAGELKEAFYYLIQASAEYGVNLVTEHYACLVGLLGRAGWLDEAEVVIRRMPFLPNVMVWKNLLVSCRIHGDRARAKRITKELWKLDPQDSAPYIMLSNIYTG